MFTNDELIRLLLKAFDYIRKITWKNKNVIAKYENILLKNFLVVSSSVHTSLNSVLSS